MREIKKSHKLDNVGYDIRGPVMDAAKRLESEGYDILKLNIGNPAPFGFKTPDEMVHDVILNLPKAEGYADSKGLFAARKAVVHATQRKGIPDVHIEDVYIGNGVSELIMMSMQGLLNTGDEVLIPSPDYPLWTAAVTLSGGRAVHYRCDESSEWLPDINDIRSKISDRTTAMVIINPNNPTGAVYPREILQQMVDLAAEKNLVVLADEIYDSILYDDSVHYPVSTLTEDALIMSFGGLSKVYRAAGFRSGWLVLSGAKHLATDFREGLDMLANMRLCSNVPAQYAIQTALGGYQSIQELVRPDGRLSVQRDIAFQMLNDIPGVHCVKPRGALYCFPGLDTERFGIDDDLRFVLDLLEEKKILTVQGTGFNWPDPDHFRVVFLPDNESLRQAMTEIGDFLSTYRQQEYVRPAERESVEQHERIE
ncbi:MAG: pyridoxal phosphate-dependent aminotransferase [Spirochaetales bacterium]|nr:pyridoxal phosphate-dependent aminotransferase [Spirochaetales bacterium]MCF7937058.1 pyridoxal phosphate-dependent aminotransferase [Spirochaetales bacterium]